MTVINAMRFNAREGAMVADGQTSFGDTGFNVATKVVSAQRLPVNVIVGGAGSASFLSLIKDDYLAAIAVANGLSRAGAADLLASSASSQKRSLVDGRLRATYALGLAELFNPEVAAANPLAVEELKKILSGNYSSFGNVKADFLVLAQDYTETSIHGAGIENDCASLSPQCYASIGSGSDVAHASISGFVQRLTRDERASINPLEGIAALVRSLNEARRNVGVGGTPQIVAIRDGKIYSPKDNETKLAGEIVLASDEGLTSQDFCSDALDNIVYQSKSFQTMDRAFKNAATSKNQLDLFLRGYKGK